MAGGRSFTPTSRDCASRDKESIQARVPLDIRHFMLIFFSCAAFSPTSPGEGGSILNTYTQRKKSDCWKDTDEHSPLKKSGLNSELQPEARVR